MRVIIYAQDLSGRKDDGHFTKPNISEALDLFFNDPDFNHFLDVDSEIPLTRDQAEAIFREEREVVFYNCTGEKVVISACRE